MTDDNREEVHATLTFDSSVDIEKIMQAEALLRDAGVTFDTGTAIDAEARREWELDYSLDGATLYKHEEQDLPTP